MNLYSIQLYDRKGLLCPVYRGEAEDFEDAYNVAVSLVSNARKENEGELKDPAIKSITMIGTKDF